MRHAAGKPGRAAPAPLAGERILMTADAVGGVWTYAVDLAAGLAARQVSTLLAVLGSGPSDEQRGAALAVPGLELVETGWPLDWTAAEPSAVLRAGAALAALADRSGVGLVHLNSPALAAGGAIEQPLVALCHSCVATWWNALRGGALPADFAWRTDLVARGYEAADALVAPSAAFARATAAAYGRPEPFVVHNGRAAGAFAPGTPAGEAVVLTAGRLWDEAKDIALLDRAAAQVDVPVLAAGPTRGPNGVSIDLRHLRALGPLGGAELGRRLAARPIFCSPARYEPFGLAVLEAAAAGCALILSDIPTFRELWSEAALFVAPDDAGGLAEAMRSLAADPPRRDALGEAARRRSRLYSCEAMVAGMLAVYDRALAGHAAEPEPIGVPAAGAPDEDRARAP